MKIIENVSDWVTLRKNMDADMFPSASLGFVPTMGALHAGHASLFQRARAENKIAVASIFVNPTQFNHAEDFQKYPKTWDHDVALLESEKIDFLFAPRYADIYPDEFRYRLSEKQESKRLEGAHRPGHFDGVLTVVMKLFQIIRPNIAYFGEKDFQQLQLIQGMVDAFFLPVRIVPCATLRESDGLAMSSRNVRLTSQGRERAPEIYQTLRTSETAAEAQKRLTERGFDVEYVEDVERRRYAAVNVDQVRLIDNVEL